MAFPILLLFGCQHPQHVEECAIEVLTLPICLGVVWASPQLLDSSHLTQIPNQLAFKISALSGNNFSQKPIVQNKTIPQ